MILIVLAAEPLDHVPQRRFPRPVICLGVFSQFPVPVAVFLRAPGHQLGPAGEKLVRVPDPLRKQQVETRLALASVPDHGCRAHVNTLSGVFRNVSHGTIFQSR